MFENLIVLMVIQTAVLVIVALMDELCSIGIYTKKDLFVWCVPTLPMVIKLVKVFIKL